MSRIDALIGATEIDVLAVSPTQARPARRAYRDLGKGSGRPAQLDFGDCFSHALA